jgi:hypothetical protein
VFYSFLKRQRLTKSPSYVIVQRYKKETLSIDCSRGTVAMTDGSLAGCNLTVSKVRHHMQENTGTWLVIH